MGGSGEGFGNLLTGVSFSNDNPSQIPLHFGREAPIQESNQSIGKGSSSQPTNFVQNPQSDNSVGHNLNIDPKEGSRIIERHLPINSPQGGERVHQPLGPSENPSAVPGPRENLFVGPAPAP